MANYAKLNNGQLEMATKMVVGNNELIYNPSDDKLVELGYKEYVPTEMLPPKEWYTQTASSARDYPVSGVNASVPRYNVDFACVLELSQVWIGKLDKAPFSGDWLLFGKQMRDVFYHYFDDK